MFIQGCAKNSNYDIISADDLLPMGSKHGNPGGKRGCPRGVMVKAMDWGIIVCEFVQSQLTRLYTHTHTHTYIYIYIYIYIYQK